MARAYDLLVRARGDTRQAQRSMREFERSMDRMNTRITQGAKRVAKAGALAFGVGLAVTLREGTKELFEQQKANAHGIPPLEELLHSELPPIERYRKCEFIEGRWHFSETPHSAQPISGFTISADVGMQYVDRLCKTYQRADEEGRRLTKILAQLSVTHGEGVPTRRYLP